MTDAAVARIKAELEFGTAFINRALVAAEGGKATLRYNNRRTAYVLDPIIVETCLVQGLDDSVLKRQPMNQQRLLR